MATVPEDKKHLDGKQTLMTQPYRGASMAVLQNGCVLLVRRARPPLQDLWSLPGGKLEAGETSIETAQREVYEETGITALVAGPLGLHKAELPVPGTESAVCSTTIDIDVFYATTNDTHPPVAADDAAEARWVALSELDNYDLTPGAARLILEAAALLNE